MQAFALSDELSAGLRELSRQEQVTLAAAFAALLYRYTGQEDLLVGLSASRRKQAEAQQMMGCFLSTVVLRADLGGEPSVGELLRRTQEASQATGSHQDVPFDAIVKAVQPERSPSYQPLVQVLLTFEPQPPALPAGWEVTQTDVGTQTSKFDLCLELDERAEGLTGRFIYNSDLFEQETISRMTGHLRMVLTGMVAEPRQPAGELDLLAKQETEQLLGDWSTGPEARADGSRSSSPGRRRRDLRQWRLSARESS
jgi:surfactin family lipopeptide synthetase A